MKIYLACPFSHWLFLVRWWRFIKATRIAGKLMSQGYIVFSPISHSFPIACFLPRPLMTSWEFWKRQDFPLVRWCDALVVIPCGKAWRLSRGVVAEIKEFKTVSPQGKLFLYHKHRVEEIRIHE